MAYERLCMIVPEDMPEEESYIRATLSLNRFSAKFVGLHSRQKPKGEPTYKAMDIYVQEKPYSQ